MTVLTLRFGWRSAFFVTGAVGFLWIVLWRAFTSSRADVLRRRRIPITRVPGVFASILRKRDFWLLAGSAVVVNSVSYFLADWIPLYLKTERGFSFAFGQHVVDARVRWTGCRQYSAREFSCRGAVTQGMNVGTARKLALRRKLRPDDLRDRCRVRHVGLCCPALLVLTAIGVAGFLVIYLTLVQESVRRTRRRSGNAGRYGKYGLRSVSPADRADSQTCTNPELRFSLIGHFLGWR